MQDVDVMLESAVRSFSEVSTVLMESATKLLSSNPTAEDVRVVAEALSSTADALWAVKQIAHTPDADVAESVLDDDAIVENVNPQVEVEVSDDAVDTVGDIANVSTFSQVAPINQAHIVADDGVERIPTADFVM